MHLQKRKAQCTTPMTNYCARWEPMTRNWLNWRSWKRRQMPTIEIGRMVNALAETQGAVYYTDDELLRALGADDSELAELAKLEAQADANDRDRAHGECTCRNARRSVLHR